MDNAKEIPLTLVAGKGKKAKLLANRTEMRSRLVLLDGE